MSASEAATRTSARRTLRVLYIEDSPHDAKLCLRQLEQAGYELSARLVTSREEFEEDLRTQPYDVVLADYRTPTWSAMEALEALKQVDKDLPFIIVTGTLGDEGAVECIKRGATDYVLKDRPARLPQAVERALEEKAAREEHQRVEASRKLLASIVESSEDAIVSRAREGNVLSWNRGAEKMFGYSAEEAIGQPISMLVPPECARELGQIQERVAQGESVGRYETVRMAKDGRRIDVSLVVSPIFDAAGRITGASSIHRTSPSASGRKRRWRGARRSSSARTPSSSSSPLWPHTTSRNRCAWWRATHNSWPSATRVSSMRTPTNSSPSRSRGPSACRS